MESFANGLCRNDPAIEIPMQERPLRGSQRAPGAPGGGPPPVFHACIFLQIPVEAEGGYRVLSST